MRTSTDGTLSLFTIGGQRKYLTGDERRRFLAAAERSTRPELRTLCATLAHTGCRISEALELTVDSVDPVDGFIAIRCLKKRSKVPVIREVPAPPELLDVLRQVHHLDGAYAGQRLWKFSRSRAWQLIKAVMADAGIVTGAQATPKGLRHGFGIHAIRCGVPINLVQRWLGHASMNTTAIYLQAMGREERAIAARMWQQGNPMDLPKTPDSTPPCDAGRSRHTSKCAAGEKPLADGSLPSKPRQLATTAVAPIR
ncbi:MAG: site-specific integrase [Hyphomicrobium sp.]|jgi:integrase